MDSNNRLEREFLTITRMLEIYCQNHHSLQDGLCGSCSALRQYSRKRLEHCPFRDSKPTCTNCTIHCYKKEMQDAVKDVMRYSGPRMIYRHPILAFFHLYDGLRKCPSVQPKADRNNCSRDRSLSHLHKE